MLDAAQKAIAFVNHRTFQDLENDERPCGGCLGGRSLASFADAGFLRFLR